MKTRENKSPIKGKLWKVSLLFITAMMLGLPQAYGSTNSAVPELPPKPQHQLTEQSISENLQEMWGIQLTALHLTASGHMIDFRYKVLDADKAAPLFKRQTKPFLVHEESGKVLAVPNTAKVGALRNSNFPKQGRIYWMFFGNNGLVQAGDKVSVVIGDFRADNLVVE